MICSQCNKEFTPTHNVQKYCSQKCAKIYLKEYRKNYHRIYNLTDKGKTSKKIGSTKYEKKDSTKKLKKEYRQTQKFKDSKKKHKKTNKYYLTLKKYQQSPQYKEYISAYVKNRSAVDPLFKLQMVIRARFNVFLKAKNMRRTNKTFVMVGCTPEFLKKHLEKQFHRHPDTHQPMNWKNHTVHGWHIDHIIPLDSAKTSEDVEKLMHYTNLQPLWAEYNLKKSNKII